MPDRTNIVDASAIGKLGAHSMHATNDSKKTSKAGRERFLRSFEERVDPEGILEPAERARRAQHLIKAHFTRLALKSAQKRRKS